MAGLVRGYKGLVYPTDFAVSSDTATVQIGYPYQIPYTITPANATNQKINWTSSNTSIATVNNKGIITAISTGTCTITGVYSYDGTTVTITVTTTEVHTTGVSLDKHSISLNPILFDWLHATISPSNTSYPQVIWSSSDETVAIVSNNGTVTYVGGGTCTITCTTVDGGYTDTCTVSCTVFVSGVTLDKHSIELPTNGTSQITAIISPNNATDKSITWSSSDTSVATVSSTGLVSYVGAGDCIITCTTTDGGFTDNCNVSCAIPVAGVTLNKTEASLSRGETIQLTATISPENATLKTVTWSSSNTSVATVDTNGLVTYISDGEATITVTTDDGGYTATCSIHNVSSLTYIYNFDDGTWTNAKLDSEGWVNGGTGLNASSGGLVFADTATDKSGNRRKDFKVPTGWKKVTLYFKGVKSSAWGGAYGSLGTVWGDNTTHDFLSIRSNYYNPQNNGLVINGSWMQQLSYRTSVEGTATLNVENWTYTSTIDGSTKTGAVTQFNITENVFFYVGLSKGYYGTPSAIYKYHVTFEY